MMIEIDASLPETRETYTAEQYRKLLAMAAEQGHLLDEADYLDSLTIRQLDNLVHGRYDA